MTRAEALQRRQLVAELYRDGTPVADIARIIGLNRDATFRLLWVMRRAGWDLPHRQPRQLKGGKA